MRRRPRRRPVSGRYASGRYASGRSRQNASGQAAPCPCALLERHSYRACTIHSASCGCSTIAMAGAKIRAWLRAISDFREWRGPPRPPPALDPDPPAAVPGCCSGHTMAIQHVHELNMRKTMGKRRSSPTGVAEVGGITRNGWTYDQIHPNHPRRLGCHPPTKVQ